MDSLAAKKVHKIKKTINLNFISFLQDVVEYLSRLFKNDFASYRDILQGLPDLNSVLMAGLNRKLRPQDFAKMIFCLRKIVEKIDQILKNSTSEMIDNRPTLLNRIFTSTSKSFCNVEKIVEFVDLDSASKNLFESIFTEISAFPMIGEKKFEIERLCSKLDEHKSEIGRKLGLFSFNYSSVSGMDYLVEVSPPNRKVPDDWTR